MLLSDGRSLARSPLLDETGCAVFSPDVALAFLSQPPAHISGAVIHYRPVEGSSRAIGPQSLLLLDSGGQYDCGTTDVTRTVHFGRPSDWQRQCFTRVLQGHIALDTMVFPEGIPGFVLDAFARRSLWASGLDYRHGTGHGVGAALNVHEGPQGISPRFGNSTGLQASMVVSNEPGYYEDGAFGIRIENLQIIAEAKTSHRFGGTSFLGFERLTLVPMQEKARGGAGAGRRRMPGPLERACARWVCV